MSLTIGEEEERPRIQAGSRPAAVSTAGSKCLPRKTKIGIYGWCFCQRWFHACATAVNFEGVQTCNAVIAGFIEFYDQRRGRLRTVWQGEHIGVDGESPVTQNDRPSPLDHGVRFGGKQSLMWWTPCEGPSPIWVYDIGYSPFLAMGWLKGPH